MCHCVFHYLRNISMMTSSIRGAQLSRKELFHYWRSLPPKGKLDQALAFVKTKLADYTLNKDEEIHLKTLLKLECEKIRAKWCKKQRRLNEFLAVYDEWLNEEIVFPMFYKQVTRSSSVGTPEPSSVGRPKKCFKDSSIKSKKRKIKHLIQEYSNEELTFAAQSGLRAAGKRDAATLIDELSSASPRRATGYKQAKRRMCMTKTERPYTAEEALALFVSNNFTVQVYKNIQRESKERGFRIYPCYDALAKEKRNCYPPVETMTITDISAEVNLQELLNHTVTRLCQKVLDAILLRPEYIDMNFKCMYKWGCDGSSGHSIYKQVFEDSNDTDEYMFIISMVPLRLIGYSEESNENLIWENPRPSSPRFCRIIKFIYKKETESLIKEECARIEKQIKELVPTIVQINGTNMSVSHELILSMIDGKVCNVLSENKSTQRCYICKSTSKEMNSTVVLKEPDETMYRFGISSLHAYIRSMECLLHIAARMDFKEWQARGEENKNKLKAAKKRIQQEFLKVGLIIDKVKPGYGTSNDGNTARCFFFEYETTARITGIDARLIHRIGTILAAIASGYEIDCSKYELYASETKNLYMTLYSWYNMPPTVHKILVHGAEIIKNCIVPIGQMSEEASEAKNKEIRKTRLGHTLKTSRVRINFDMLKYLLLSSDPHISLLRKLPSKSSYKRFPDVNLLLKS